MNVLLVQIDGKMPNLALMRIAAHHRANGDSVHLVQYRRPRKEASIADAELGLFDQWDKVYASLIFTKSQPVARRLKEVYPHAIIGGTGWGFQTTSQFGIPEEGIRDYTIYPSERRSIGFSQRGCRLDCSEFCVVPKKEGHVRDVATIHQVWRGDPWPREIVLLDNDFFGSPTWKEKIEEVKAGGFKLSLSQGINARMLSDEAAAAIASVKYRNDEMSRPCIHTAWDNLGDEKPLFRGLNALKRHGVKPDNITVYMLIGLRERRITDEDFERQRKLREFGCRPYPMPFVRGKIGEEGHDLVRFQTWVLGAYDKDLPSRKAVSWDAWMRAKGQPKNLGTGRIEIMERQGA